MNTWRRKARAAVAAGKVQRGGLYGMAGVLLVLAVLVSVSPEWGGAAAATAGDLVTRFWPGLLLCIFAALLAATARTGGRRVNAQRRRLPRLVPLLVHVALLLALATAVAVGVGALLWTAVGRPTLTGTPDAPIATPSAMPAVQPPASGGPARWTLTNTFDAMKIVLSVVAGIGGVVALTVAYRRQHLGEAAEQREDTKLFTERFGKAAEQLGSDKAAVRLAGVHAMAALADDWPAGRQTCIDVLCAYLRMPYTPPDDQPDDQPSTADAPADAPYSSRRRRLRALLQPSPPPPDTPDAAALEADHRLDANRREERQVRHTIIRLIRDHLRLPTEDPRTWQGRDFDFTGAVFDGGDLSGSHFSSGMVSFNDAQFSGGMVSFNDAQFSGGAVSFSGARFSGGRVFFSGAEFSGGRVFFFGARFSGGAVFFNAGRFSGGRVAFFGARFSGGAVSFNGARFSGGRVLFSGAEFSGGTVFFYAAQFLGGTVDLSEPGDWTRAPEFEAWPASPPPGLQLPAGRPPATTPRSSGAAGAVAGSAGVDDRRRADLAVTRDTNLSPNISAG